MSIVSFTATNTPALEPMPCSFPNDLYARLRATGYDAEIKRGVRGWRMYLLDRAGNRVAVPGVDCGKEINRVGSERVDKVNVRLKGPRGFRRDSQLFAVLTAFVEFAECATRQK